MKDGSVSVVFVKKKDADIITIIMKKDKAARQAQELAPAAVVPARLAARRTQVTAASRTAAMVRVRRLRRAVPAAPAALAALD